MKVYKDIDLIDFEFWSGAKQYVDNLTSDDLETLQYYIEGMFPDGIEEVQLNDIFWFEQEALDELLEEK